MWNLDKQSVDEIKEKGRKNIFFVIKKEREDKDKEKDRQEGRKEGRKVMENEKKRTRKWKRK